MTAKVAGLVLLGLIAASGADDPGPKNLVTNGDFEAGGVSPAGWQTVDGLSSFWVKDDDPAHGMVLKFDTDVLQSQGYDWWIKIASGASPKDAPRKRPTVEPKYDTLAGLDGTWFWSDYIPVEPGKAYWLTFDAKGTEGPLYTWLVGYKEKGSTAFGADAAAFQEALKSKATGKPPVADRKREVFVHNYVWKGQLMAGVTRGWKTYARRAQPFRPTENTPGVRFVRVLLLPLWPPGTYYVDNVRLVEHADPAPEK